MTKQTFIFIRDTLIAATITAGIIGCYIVAWYP